METHTVSQCRKPFIITNFLFIIFVLVIVGIVSCTKNNADSSGTTFKRSVQDCPLCIYFTSFNAVKEECNASISWAYNIEPINYSIFQVECSKNGIDFYPVATVNGHPGQTGNSYTYITYSPDIALFYRVINIDQNGNKSYSTVEKIVGGSGSCPAVFNTTGNVNMNVLGLHIKSITSFPFAGQSVVIAPNSLFLTKGNSIYTANGTYRLTLQLDGNLVLYNKYTYQVLWASNTTGTNPYGVWFQGDGNIVMYTNSNGTGVIWASNKYSSNQGTYFGLKVSDVRLVFQNDGNLVLELPEPASGLAGVIAATDNYNLTPSPHFGQFN